MGRGCAAARPRDQESAHADQLAAERLQAKLGNKLPAEAARALDHATETIVAQVTAMKNMVDDFRDYARTPLPQLEGLDSEPPDRGSACLV